MKRIIVALFLLILVLPDTTAQESAEFIPGNTFMQTAGGDSPVTYHVKIPDNYRQGELRPVLIAYAASGSGKGILRNTEQGAQKAGWIVVGCDSLRNHLKDRAKAEQWEDAILEDVYRTLPVDRERVYLGGMSGGAWRAYHVSARRDDPFAGILAYGGWLGGYSPQELPYTEGMSVAVINGVRDRGANAWAAMDTESLEKRSCSVKYYTFDGGHQVAPSEVTEAVIGWMEEEWTRKKQAEPEKHIPIDVLFIGDDPERSEAFRSFLTEHFRSVELVRPGDLNTSLVNKADVLILDAEVNTLLEGCAKAMVFLGSQASGTARYYGSKIGSGQECLFSEEFYVNRQHPLFAGSVAVKPGDWSVEMVKGDGGFLCDWENFRNSGDTEILAGGRGEEGAYGLAVLREAHRLFWGFGGSPDAMSEQGKAVFVNALTWINDFSGHQQSSSSGLTSRSSIPAIFADPGLDRADLCGYFPKQVLDSFDFNRGKILRYYMDRMGYVHTPFGSGLLAIDEDAMELGTPNNQLASLEQWISMIGGEYSKTAQGLLLRYSGQRIRGRKNWKQWYEASASTLYYSDEKGYSFFNREESPTQLISGYVPFRFRPAAGWLAVDTVTAVEGEGRFKVNKEERSPGKILINGTEKNRSAYLFTKGEYGDVELHLEFMVPQGSNAGVYLMGRYEIQIFDSYGIKEAKFSDLGGVYQRWDPSGEGSPGYEGVAPRVNAARAPGEWQTMDIEFRAPRFDEKGTKLENARFISVKVNGKLVQENVEVSGPTRAHPITGEAPLGPVAIQGDHGPIAIRSYTLRPAMFE